MKTKRRTVNADTNVCSKKIITRNMKNKIAEDRRNLSVPTNCHNRSTTKNSPNTRAKCSSAGKLDSDPYSISKMDDECKIPIKKMKMMDKTVNTCNFTTMTDPELLGPCEPGTSIELQGIVWLETETGLLVINVTWRGRTYVGTLLDSTKYEFAPSFVSQDFQGKSENRSTNRQNRCKKVYVPTTTNYHSGLRSNTIRHSRRLSESFSYSNNGKKSLGRLAHNTNSCYVDTLSLSADASGSGESDGDFNNYQKCSLASKTRSVTRSLAKQNKVANIIENDNSNDLMACSQPGCFKKFSNVAALQYHLQRSHNIFEEMSTADQMMNETNDQNGMDEKIAKEEAMESELDTDTRLNGIVKQENDSFEFNSDPQMETYDEEKNKNDFIQDDFCLIKSEAVQTQFSELSVNLPKLSEVISASYCTTISPSEALSSPKEIFTNECSPVNLDQHTAHLTLDITKTISTATTENSIPFGNLVSQLNSVTRTISAPTVSIPFESSTLVTSTGLLSNSTLSPALIRPKPITASSTLSNNFPSRKLKPSKTSSIANNSFQIPSSTSLKRPLIPLKVAVTCPNRLFSSSSTVNMVSSNHSPRHIRNSSFSSVTPILPATSASSVSSPTISNAITSSGSSTKRAVVTPTNSSPSSITTLLNLKPIQPKPKSSSSLSTYPSPTSSTFPSQLPTATITGLVPNQTSYQRQILPSPVTKTDTFTYSDERFVQKIDNLKSSQSVKKKRRKPDKKLRINFADGNRLKKFPLNPIQPRHKKEFQHFNSKNSDLLPLGDNFKMDEENSHSPEYSDLSETNDTPAPILEKEIELKSGDCDKLIICTDLETTSSSRISSACSDSYDDTKYNTIYNKPPALMPAVLSTDLLNGSTNDIDLSDTSVKVGRKKLSVHNKSPNSTDLNKTLSKSYNDKKSTFEAEFPTSLRHNNTNTSSRRSFQSSSFEPQITSSSLYSSSSSSTSTSLSKPTLYNSSSHECHDYSQTSKLKFPVKCANLSAINDYVWMTKNSHDSKLKGTGKIIDNSHLSKITLDGDCVKKKVLPNKSIQENGRFSVQALTSPQEIVSRSFTTSSTVISVNPSTKLTNTLFKN